MDPPHEQQTREAQANVVSQHLAPGYSADNDLIRDRGRDASTPSRHLSPTGQESSLNLQGGDMHRSLYKLDARARQPQRAATFSYPKSRDRDPTFSGHALSASEQRAPGGFRRQYFLDQQQQRGLGKVVKPVTKSFVDFLDLYGGFAGEDLYDSDDESTLQSDTESAQQQQRSPERRPLLGRRKSSRRATKPGDAGTFKTFFTLLKAFIGTGILFLPKAFNNGGLIFSLVVLLSVAALSTLCFRLLLQCRAKYSGGYGELGEAIGGPTLRTLILASITISQVGFVCASLIFVAENLESVLAAFTVGPNSPLSSNAVIGLQLLLLIPFALIRNISKLGPAAMLADIFIAVGLGYIYYYDIATLSWRGVQASVVMFNPSSFTLTIGSAIFTFEGIGLILPIQSSMKEPQKFGRLLYIVMMIITVIFASIGALSYATFGKYTMTEVMSNFPQSSKLVNAVQAIYSLAVCVGTPVQLFPAVRIIEGKVFGRRSGKMDSLTKWKKNMLRVSIVVLAGVISILGASDLDKFVALIGSFACVPLVYIYPAYLHYAGVAETKFAKTLDIFLMTLGMAAMFFTTAITVVRWIAE